MRSDSKGNWFTEDTDNCSHCPFYNNPDAACPLMEALAGGIVYSEYADFGVRNCGIFQAIKGKLDLPDHTVPTLKRVK